MSQWNPTLCVYQSRKPQRLGATPPHRQGPAKQGRWCGAWYLAHLAVVLLVVREIVWHLGSTQGKQGGERITALLDTRRQGQEGPAQWEVQRPRAAALSVTSTGGTHPQAAPPGPLPPSAIGHTLSRRWQREGGSPTCGRHGPGLASPVRSGDTHVPSAGMTKTPACVVHLPGKEKRG